MAKAFDSLDHRFIDQVYKFFGFRDNIIRWLRLLGNSMQACISLDNNINSRYFDLGSGRPQGNNLSLVTFNFCEQILIFKLELDPILERIPRNNPMLNLSADPFLFESNRETANNESLADDNTIITMLTEASLSGIKNILLDFEAISGLWCNYDKTVLMPTFEPSEYENEFITRLGFKVADKIRLLGMDITCNFQDLGNNFLTIKDKLKKLIH
jgi:hypothetical protein